MSWYVDLLTDQYTYLLFALLTGIGLYMVVSSPNLVRKVIGVNLFQTALFLLFISTAYRAGGLVPVINDKKIDPDVVSNIASPLPQVLVLTAIVVGVALTAVALALIVRIHAEYGTLREDSLKEVSFDD
jgi:multicomponent Na+:H+ antiporter subunit C